MRTILDYLVNKIESKIGLDLNGDGRIGGPGITAKIEKATHVDLNRDGIIGGYRPPPGGGTRFPSIIDVLRDHLVYFLVQKV